MKRLIVTLLAVCCVSCNTDHTPDPLMVPLNKEFLLAQSQQAILEIEGLSASAKLTNIEDKRCPDSDNPPLQCFTAGFVGVALEAQAGDEKAQASLCIGTCLMEGRVKTVDSVDVQLRDRSFRVYLKDVVPHRREYFRENKTPTLSAKLLVKQIN